MSENTKLWDTLGHTDPKHTKPFTRGGGFKGTAIKPMWSYLRMTEEFGPCGQGWGIGEPSFQVVPGPEGEMLVFCTTSIWYGDARPVYGVGGDKAVGKNKYGLNSDDEAFKKAFTDAVTNALKMIGVGADVHMGLFDDSKYVNSMLEEFSDPPANEQAAPKRQVGWSKDGTTRTAHSLKKEKVWDEFQMELLECETPSMVTKLALAWSKKVEDDSWPESWKTVLREEMQKRMDLLKSKPAPDDDEFQMDRQANALEAR